MRTDDIDHDNYISIELIVNSADDEQFDYLLRSIPQNIIEPYANEFDSLVPINDKHRQSYADMLEIITKCIDNTRAQFIASPAGGNDTEVAQSAKFLEELDRLLVPWAPDDAHTSIQLSSLLRFYSGGERSTTDKHHLQTSLTRLARLHQCYAFRHTSSPLISLLSDTFRKGYTAHINSLNNPLAGWWLTVVPRGATQRDAGW